MRAASAPPDATRAAPLNRGNRPPIATPAHQTRAEPARPAVAKPAHPTQAEAAPRTVPAKPRAVLTSLAHRGLALPKVAPDSLARQAIVHTLARAPAKPAHPAAAALRQPASPTLPTETLPPDSGQSPAGSPRRRNHGRPPPFRSPRILTAWALPARVAATAGRPLAHYRARASSASPSESRMPLNPRSAGSP